MIFSNTLIYPNSSLEDLISARPEGFSEDMLPLLSDLTKPTTNFEQVEINTSSVSIGLVSSAEASAGGASSTTIAILVLEALAVKYGRQVAIGFGKFAFKHGMKIIPGVGLAITAYEIYDIYNQLTNAYSVSLKERKASAKEVMRSDAAAMIKPDDCEYLKSLPNDQLAQHFANLAGKVEMPKILRESRPKVIGIYGHTNLKTINDTFARVCKQERFKAESHFINDEPFDPEGKPRGSTKGVPRTDLHTIEDDLEYHAVYNYKTAKQGVTKSEYDEHREKNPNSTLLQLRSGELAPKVVYDPKNPTQQPNFKDYGL